MKTIFESATHKMEVPDNAIINDPSISERTWRDSELLRTDALMLLDDYPKKSSLATYRAKLRNYPTSENFPHGERPTE